MSESTTLVTFLIFFLTILFTIWKPFGINETIPTATGALLLIIIGVVPFKDLLSIFDIVSGPSFTILSTIVMSIVLESVGFFNWMAFNLVRRSKGSGKKLFLNVLYLCFLTTIFFNNDGSILITTPILIKVVKDVGLKPHQQFGYLISGALIATASSAPIAISNIANLIALKIVGLDLNTYVKMLFVPSMIGIVTMGFLLFLYFKKDIPQKVRLASETSQLVTQKKHPLQTIAEKEIVDQSMFKVAIVLVVLIRSSYFILTPLGVPIEVIAIVGALTLLGLRYYKQNIGAMDVIKRTPWHVLLFAFSMYVIVFGLQNVGLTHYLVAHLGPVVKYNNLNAIFIMGGVLTVFSNIVNNLPSVMIGTLALTGMGLSKLTLQITYLASIIGSDIGSLISPMGTLASLIWLFILRKNRIPITWGKYMGVALFVIPVCTVVSLVCLYFWSEWVIL